MTRFSLLKIPHVAVLSLMGLTLLTTPVTAQTTKVEGLIQGRSGDTMTLKTSQSPEIVVLLTDSTDVDQVQGILKARKKEMSMAALIPGLAVKVEGTYNDQNQLVANSVSFKGNDLERAQSLQAGMHETQVRAQQNKKE